MALVLDLNRSDHYFASEHGNLFSVTGDVEPCLVDMDNVGSGPVRPAIRRILVKAKFDLILPVGKRSFGVIR